MNEAAVSRKLREQLVLDGALCWKICDRFHASRPDLLVLHSGVTGYIETKIYPATPTALQALTLADLRSHGAPVWALTYIKKTKMLVMNTVVTGVEYTGLGYQFTDFKGLSKWLLEQLSSSTKP